MLDWNDRESIKEFIKQNDIKDIIQLNNVIKKMMGAMIEEMLRFVVALQGQSNLISTFGAA